MDKHSSLFCGSVGEKEFYCIETSMKQLTKSWTVTPRFHPLLKIKAVKIYCVKPPNKIVKTSLKILVKSKKRYSEGD
jgi:hypothetical protein